MKKNVYKEREDVTHSKLYNKDLAPTCIEERTWNTYNFTVLWFGMADCIPTYMLAGGLISLGMDWTQALFTITLGNLIVLIPLLLNSHPGAKYGISFPVLARASFGTKGANIPAVLRAVIACGWFGINTFIGGTALNIFVSGIIPGWNTLGGSFQILGLSISAALTFMIFWGIEMFIIFKGMEVVKKLQTLVAPLVMVLAVVLLVWAIVIAKGFGPILNEPSKFKSTDEFLKVFIPSLTAMIGYWAPVSLNISDFTRFAKGQKEQMIGQSIGLPVGMTVFSAMGIVITSATAIIFGKAMWNPTEIIGKFSNPIVLLVGFFGIIAASLSVNITANIVSPAYDFSNLLPKYISFKIGALITGIIGILIMPWRLLADPSGYVYNWLGTYSGVLGPITAIIIYDYWILRKRDLNLKAFFMEDGEYSYTNGFNIKAIVTLVIGVFVALIGKVVPSLSILADYSWFSGLAVSFVIYHGLNTSKKKY